MANDFSGDPNCVALWKFDNNANDAKGGNHLTAVNTPTYDSSNKKEGTHSADCEKDSIQYFTIADGSLDAGFPGKSGTSEQSFSICLWVKPETVSGTSQGLVNKYVSASNERSFNAYLRTDSKVEFTIGYNGGASYTSLTFGTVLSAGKWYHIGVVYDASTNGMKIRIWDDNAGALLGSNASGTAGGDMSPDTADLEIGRYGENDSYAYDGKIDEIAFFKDVLTDNEIDQIRAGTYSGGLTAKSSSDTGSGADAVDSLQTPQAKTSSDVGSGAEGTPTQSAVLAGSESGSGLEAIIARLLTDDESGSAVESAQIVGLLKDLFASEAAEGADQLVAKIEMPVKGGGMKLWT
jgi:hypothetical protein